MIIKSVTIFGLVSSPAQSAWKGAGDETIFWRFSASESQLDAQRLEEMHPSPISKGNNQLYLYVLTSSSLVHSIWSPRSLLLEMVVIELRISPKSSPNLSPQSSPWDQSRVQSPGFALTLCPDPFSPRAWKGAGHETRATPVGNHLSTRIDSTKHSVNRIQIFEWHWSRGSSSWFYL